MEVARGILKPSPIPIPDITKEEVTAAFTKYAKRDSAPGSTGLKYPQMTLWRNSAKHAWVHTLHTDI